MDWLCWLSYCNIEKGLIYVNPFFENILYIKDLQISEFLHRIEHDRNFTGDKVVFGNLNLILK